jgi:phosphate transport system substrate-binding protein
LRDTASIIKQGINMKTKSFAVRLLGTTSTLALSAAAFLASTGAPANAQATQGLYFGGSLLAEEAFRQILDCYTGAIVSNGNAAHSDGFTFSALFDPTKPTPGLLPTSCTVTSTVQGMYAGVGDGQRGFIANNPQQWYAGGVPNPLSNILIGLWQVLPAAQPSIIDYTNPQGSVFGSYPYPRVDIALSDAPLPTGALTAPLAGLTTVSESFNPTQSWVTSGGSLAAITLNSTAPVVSYSTTATFGTPIQIPAFEVNVAIPVNVSLFTTNNSHIAPASPANVANPGAAVQLTTAQLCAIFSGLVTDWNDSTTLIPYLDNGTPGFFPAVAKLQTTLFDSANVGNGQGTPAPYSSSSLPINLTYRSDSSGTSFIIQNYLHAVCPLLAGPLDLFKYNAIFGPTFVPSTSFTTLINQIVAARGNGVWNRTATSGARWIPAYGSADVASTISDTSTAAGNIGYVSADFTQPFTTTVAGAGVDAPFAAALQNEDLRGQGIYFPNTMSTSTLTFIPPTPAGAGNAWSDSLIQSAASSTWTFANYNVYGITFVAVTTHSGVTLSGQSVLPLTSVAGAYPLSGTTFLELYSCYSVAADANRVTNLKNFLFWYLSEGTLVTSVIQNAAFNPLPSPWASTIKTKYINGALSRTKIAAAPASGAGDSNSQGCNGVTGGAL